MEHWWPFPEVVTQSKLLQEFIKDSRRLHKKLENILNTTVLNCLNLFLSKTRSYKEAKTIVNQI